MTRCSRCGKELTDPDSVAAGMGPDCRARADMAQDESREQNLRCHKGMVCYAPKHAGTTIDRFWNRFSAMADQVSLLSRDSVSHIASLVEQFKDTLGLNRDSVPVPEIDVPMFGRETIGKLGIQGEDLIDGTRGYAMPVDHDEQYRCVELRRMEICPFGLDCRDPGRAVALIGIIAAHMERDVEPELVFTHSEWAWDRLMYQSLANSLEVLGMTAEGAEIMDMVRRKGNG